MNISFEQDDRLNSLVTDTNTGAALYQIETHRNFVLGSTTTIHRLSQAGGSPQLVSCFQQRLLASDLVSFDGKQWSPVKDFLVRRNELSSSRTFIAPNGSKYKWKLKLNKFRLVEVGSKDVVAQSYRPKPGVISTEPRNKLNLDLTAQATSFIDLVVLTFIIMETYEDWQNSRRNVAMTLASSPSGGLH